MNWFAILAIFAAGFALGVYLSPAILRSFMAVRRRYYKPVLFQRFQVPPVMQASASGTYVTKTVDTTHNSDDAG